MCIIAAKPAGIPMPDRDTIKRMWDANPDGAGLMYVEKGKVRIEKGFMKYKAFSKALDQIEKRLDLTVAPVVLHFRIMTHGGVNPECTHPFPITDNVGALKKLKASVDIGVAHNGVIHSVTPRKDLSDTMEYIATQLAPLKRALPKFYENKHARLLIQNAIESKMAFLTEGGKIYTLGDFVTDKGILYSNTSYKERSFRSSAWGCYGLDVDYEDDWNGYGWGQPRTGNPWQDADDLRTLCWLPEGAYVKVEGELFDGEDFLIAENGTVYQYDYGYDCATPCPGVTAYSPEGLPARFDWEEADTVPVMFP